MKKIFLLFFCFSYLTFAQDDEPANGTFYQTGGKVFEAIGSKDMFYQLNISIDDTTKEFTLRRIEPKLPESPDSVSFTKFDDDILRNRLKILFPGIDSLALSTLMDELNKSHQNYEKNKATKNFTRQLDKTTKEFTKLLDKEKRNIGKIGFRKNPRDFTVPVYNWDTDSTGDYIMIGHFEVKNAQIAFGDGVISKINVNGTLKKNDGQEIRMMFYNFLPPIPIRTREQIDFLNAYEWEYRYWLDAQYEEENDPMSYYIYLSDVLYYEQNLIYNYGIYIPPDGKVITLDDSVDVFDLRKESFANDFDLRLYTDITGLNADNPNGLIKFMGNYKLNLKSFKLNIKTLKYYENRKSLPLNVVCLKYANLFFNFNKIESDELVLPIKPGNDYLYSTTFDLYRYTKFELGIDLNLIYLQLQYQSFSFNLLLGVYHTPVDSTFQIDNESLSISEGVNSFYSGLKLNYKFFANEYVDLKLSYSIILPQLFSNNKLKEIYGPIDDSNSEGNTRVRYFDDDFLIHRINTELSIFADPQDRSSFIFLKAILNFNSSDNYISLLLGYAIPFSNIFAIGQATR